MKPVLTAKQMRSAEETLFARGVRSIDLMERAASELSKHVLEHLPMNGTCVFACGSGGNGGDGYACARMVAERGVRTIVISSEPPRNPDAVANREAAKEKLFALVDANELERLPRPDVWVDCLFGTGLARRIGGKAEELITRINRDREDGSFVISCDIPSGLNADSGAIDGACVTADETVTFQERKRGHYLGEGLAVCGELSVADIRIPKDCFAKETMRLAEDEDIKRVLPPRKRTAHKNDFGHLLIVAGSRGMAGAAALTAMAALRTGAGLVTIACPDSILDILQTLVPCAMCVGLNETDGALNDAAAEELKKALEGKNAVAIGPGLSKRASAKCISVVLESGLKAVIDADALNIIAAESGLKKLLKAHHAITPHPGEAARLLGESGLEAGECADKLRSLGCKALLKGAVSLIAGENMTLSASGCVGMAKGGSGDALTGIVGALLVQGLDAETALWAGSQIHGRAGEIAQEERGVASMLSTDLIEHIGDVLCF